MPNFEQMDAAERVNSTVNGDEGCGGLMKERISLFEQAWLAERCAGSTAGQYLPGLDLTSEEDPSDEVPAPKPEADSPRDSASQRPPTTDESIARSAPGPSQETDRPAPSSSEEVMERRRQQLEGGRPSSIERPQMMPIERESASSSDYPSSILSSYPGRLFPSPASPQAVPQSSSTI